MRYAFPRGFTRCVSLIIMSHCFEVTRYAVCVMRSLAGLLVAFHNNVIFSYSHILIVQRKLIFSLFKESSYSHVSLFKEISYSHILIVQRKLIFSYSHCSKKTHILIVHKKAHHLTVSKAGGQLDPQAGKGRHISAHAVAADFAAGFPSGKDEDIAVVKEADPGFGIGPVAAFHDG